MSGSATAWLPLRRAKAELRIPREVADHDDLIAGHIEAAVNHVERETGLPLIDRRDTLRVCATGMAPMNLGWLVAAREVAGVRYWSSVAAQRLPPDQVVANETLGELRAGRPSVGWSKEWFLYPPADGWPKALSGLFEVEIVRGLRSPLHPSLTQAVVLLMRGFYEGADMVRRPNAVTRLLQPYMGDRR